ncbi:MAG: RNA-binding protein with serine-rich domain 1 [archaeon]|nr:RNA-binding protein with serine-rich domain 1 [archaeon]
MEKKDEEEQRYIILVVQGLTKNVNKAHLKEIFGNYGEINEVYFPIDNSTRLNKNYAFVEFKDLNDAEKASLFMDGGQIDGVFIKTEILNYEEFDCLLNVENEEKEEYKEIENNEENKNKEDNNKNYKSREKYKGSPKNNYYRSKDRSNSRESRSQSYKRSPRNRNKYRSKSKSKSSERSRSREERRKSSYNKKYKK